MTFYLDYEGFMQELGLDIEGRDEIKKLLESRLAKDSLGDLLDESFRREVYQKGSFVSRFSDGSFPVFYGAMEVETAEAEARYWASRRFGKPGANRITYYQRFTCDFDGYVKDLRSKQTEWPALIDNSDYGFCNKLGAEAKTSVDGLLTPSVRRPGGINIPVFSRRAISNARDTELVPITATLQVEDDLTGVATCA